MRFVNPRAFLERLGSSTHDRIGGKVILGAVWPTRHATRKMWRRVDRAAPIGYSLLVRIAPQVAESGPYSHRLQSGEQQDITVLT
jgi:hypothetical protein